MEVVYELLWCVVSRAKMATVRSISRLKGQANSLLYPQPKGLLGECMVKYGRELGDESMSLFSVRFCETIVGNLGVSMKIAYLRVILIISEKHFNTVAGQYLFNNDI